MSKSLHIIASRRLGGAESFYMRLIRALQLSGDQVVAMNRADSLVAQQLGATVTQYHSKMRNQWDVLSRLTIDRAIKRERPEVVQTYMTRATMLTRIKPGKGPLHIARLGGYYNLKRFAHAHAWVGNTKGICDFLVAAGLPADKVFYIGNFVGETTQHDAKALLPYREQLNIPGDAFVMFALGRLIPKKGFDTLIQAFAALPASVDGRPIHLVIAGDGPMLSAWQELAASVNCAQRIHWPGWITDASPYFCMADLFVCPSREEPLGNVILEGWAYAKPVVSTATMGGNELISDGNNGLLVALDDPPAMAQALQRCLNDEALRQGLAQAGQQQVTTRFTRQAIVQQYQELYERLT